MAVIEEGEESEEARPTTSQGRHKRKTGPEGQLTKAPHRKRAKDRLESVYKTLFLRGEGSDVQIRALGKEGTCTRSTCAGQDTLLACSVVRGVRQPWIL